MEKVRSFFIGARQRLPFAIHMVMNPIIEVDRHNAYAEGDQAVWGSARYGEVYVRVDGAWMFKHLKLTSFFRTPFGQGWAKTRLTWAGSS